MSADGAPAGTALSTPGARAGTGATALTGAVRASGTGAWPGLEPLVAVRDVFDVLGSGAGSGEGLPFLPELPARGPGADPVGRTAALLVDLPVDLQPVGWRLVDHPGRDATRARSFWTADTDALAEAADGWAGPLLLSVVGPWTLAAAVWLPRGERVAVDAGAARDLVASLAQGVAEHAARVAALVPGAELVLQVDEPSLPSVLAGRVPTASGWGRLSPVDALLAREGLQAVVKAAPCPVVLRCTSPAAPLELLRESGASALAVDATRLDAAAWEVLATAVEAGLVPWLGVADPSAASVALPATSALVEAVLQPWRQVGQDVELLASAVLTPTTGQAGSSPTAARAALGRLREAAGALAEAAAGG